jgi:hypothetical protein
VVSTEGGTPDSTPDHPQDRKGQRKHPRMAVVSVAAAVLLAGGGGAYWASTAADGKGSGAAGTPGGEATPPPLALDGYHQGGGPSQGIAVGEPDPNGVRYRAEGKLPAGPRTAPVYLPKDDVTREEVASLAKALDVKGTPQLDQGVWRVGGTPGAGEPTLQVNGKGPGNWSYARYGTPGGPGCMHPPGAGPEKSLDKVLSPDPASALKCPPQYRSGTNDGQPVSEEKAKSVAMPVLKALGQDDAKIDAHGLFGAVRTVESDPVLNGTPTYGWQTRLEVGSDGQLVGGGGQLQAPVKGAEYPLISADEALAQLNKAGGGTAGGGIGGCATAVPYGEEVAGPCQGKPRPAEPAVVTRASFALASQYVRGRQALVPSWLFEMRLDKGTTVPVVQPAVDPKYIAKPSPSSPSTRKSTPVRVESYTVDGKKLVLHFWGGVCSDYAASAEQSEAAVTVKVIGTEKHPGQKCVLIAKRFDETVTLDEPLGDRKVVDATTGETVEQKQEK